MMGNEENKVNEEGTTTRTTTTRGTSYIQSSGSFSPKKEMVEPLSLSLYVCIPM